MNTSDFESVRDYLMGFQDAVCAAIEAADGEARFQRETLENERGGRARPRVLEDGPKIERAAVNFSHTVGQSMPKAATQKRPELAGAAFQAVSVSLIVHPRNPYAPTTHANFRCFRAQPVASAGAPAPDSVWWFGGGFDLTPYYGFEEDARHWHGTAREACEPFGSEVYPKLKQTCDEYFYLPHRKEPRGIGGLFFDDLNADGFERSFALMRSIADRFLPAYLPILERRKDQPYGERERDFQLYRRGRYVEFNLAYDRGTRFGLEAGGRTESILASMPSEVRWRYNWKPEPGTPEAELYDVYLQPRDWA